MLGAIIGDMVGSVYEFHNHRSKEFPFFSDDCWPTDDSIMTVALAKALLETDGKAEGLSRQAVRWMRRIGQQYPNCGYGGRFYGWMFSEHPRPYRSYGNGAAMRVSACGWAAGSVDEAKVLADAVTRVTHDHEEGIRGAEAAACAIYLARTGSSKEDIRAFIEDNYYDLDFTLDEIRPGYRFNESCQGTVPQAIEAWLDGDTRGLFDPGPGSKTLVDLRLANARRLQQLGVRAENIDISGECTKCSHEKYWSHRYTKGLRGSQASAIML